LVAETTSKVADSTFAISTSVLDLPDVIEHMAAREQEHGNQAEGGPKVAVLQDRNEVGGGNGDEGDATKNSSGDGDNLHPVEGSADDGLGDISRQLAGYPGVNLLGRLGT
jgi:hypothetical protein